MCYGVDIFFFKQKTAYEMRISDWSSDVCSSDLPREPREPRRDIAAQQQRFDIGTQASPLRRAARAAVAQARAPRQIGRAACRERVCPCVSISVVAGYFKKNKTPTTPLHIDTHSIHIAKP